MHMHDTYLTQLTRPATVRLQKVALPGQINCVLARRGTFKSNAACLAATSCGYRWGFDAAQRVCKRMKGGTFPSQTECLKARRLKRYACW